MCEPAFKGIYDLLIKGKVIVAERKETTENEEGTTS